MIFGLSENIKCKLTGPPPKKRGMQYNRHCWLLKKNFRRLSFYQPLTSGLQWNGKNIQPSIIHNPVYSNL
jgi:hypothetical protein